MLVTLLQNPRNSKFQQAEILKNYYGNGKHGFRFEKEPWIYNVVEVNVPQFILDKIDQKDF